MKELNLDDLDSVAGGVGLRSLGLTGGGAGSEFIDSHLQNSASGAGMPSFVGDLLNTPVIGQAITGLMHSFEGGNANGLNQIVSQLAPMVSQLAPMVSQLAPIISAFTGQGAGGAANGLGALGPILNAFGGGGAQQGAIGVPGGVPSGSAPGTGSAF